MSSLDPEFLEQLHHPPPTESLTACASANRATPAAKSHALENLVPPGPSTPTISVSQYWQIAWARSISRPEQRLHPEKRQNTARGSVFAPSRRGVLKISFTA
jgi:hypothetical protein